MYRIVEAKEIPKGNRTYCAISEEIKRFYDSDLTIGKIEDDHYKHPYICRNCAVRAIKKLGYPIKVRQRGDTIYLEKYLET